MMDSTVHVVLILVSLGTATDGKWEKMTLRFAYWSQHLCLLTVALNTTAKYSTAGTYSTLNLCMQSAG